MDQELVTRAQLGDEEAFRSLAVACGDRLHAIAHRILREAHLAEDATQQALIAIWQHLPALRDPSRFDAWSYRLLVNACHDEARRRRRAWQPTGRVFYDDDRPAPDDLGRVHDRDQLERGFRRLSVDQRAVVVLHTYVGLTEGEVAAVLGVPVGTVSSRLHYAVRAMRAALEADERPVVPEAVR